MLRRDLVTLMVCAVVAAPRAVRGQQAQQIRRVGALMAWSEDDALSKASVAAFAQALAGLGWVNGTNIRIDYRFAQGKQDLFKNYAAELLALHPDLILASTPPAVIEVGQQSPTTPIVFVLVVDPIQLGFGGSLARPGKNMTGFTSYEPPLMGKWVELLKQVAPDITDLLSMYNPYAAATYADSFNKVIATAAESLGLKVKFAAVRDDHEIEQTLSSQANGSGCGLICLPDAFLVTHRELIVANAIRRGMPMISVDLFVRVGALLSYWFDPIALYAEAAPYVDRILKGTHPADLPIQHPTKFSLVINMKTARVLGLTIPPALLARADEVIE